MAYCIRMKKIFQVNRKAALRPFEMPQGPQAQGPPNQRMMTIRWLTVRKYPVSSVKVRR